ncbi:response regulator transcription factor [Naasia sp. SYSU D00948]|uniref:response regulator n=1 Tax=Naasia sp. SYSU D00948 TaxID=2817379 RepID=UPI001B30712D|nr:response regulator transcription factor [Naasia sp. SYSU D00948]
MPVSTPPRRPPRLRVAIVDDHRLVLDGLEARLGAPRTGLQVVAAVPSWGALVSHPEFPVDVVILDLNLEDNIPVSTKLRVLNAAGSKTVVISRHADSGSIYGAIQAGAAAFVGKTESADALIATVHAAADGRAEPSDAVRKALDDFESTVEPNLGRQEQRALVLYASGRSIKEVASDMSTTEETIKSYIKRGRRKYRAIGVDLGTKVLLRRHAIREGWITPE